MKPVYSKCICDTHVALTMNMHLLKVEIDCIALLCHVTRRRSLVGSEQRLGPDHPSTLTAYNNMAALLQAQGKLAEAENLYRQNLQVRSAWRNRWEHYVLCCLLGAV